MVAFDEFRSAYSNAGLADVQNPLGHKKYAIDNVLCEECDADSTTETAMKPLVMFVDDDPMILASLHRQLPRKLTSHEFVFCESGYKALAEAAKRTPDLLFSDMRMPGMDGLAFLSEFLKRYPNTPCFAMTGHFAATDRVQVESLVQQVLCKPVDCTEIAELIKTATSKSSFN